MIDPNVHRRYRSIVGCLSYLVNMTRPDLAFSYSQLSKFVQYPGMAHLEAAERVLQYLRGTYDQGISFYDLSPDKRNKLGGWLRGFGYTQKGPTEIWEENASCIMMSENPTNRDRSRHVDVKVHFLRDLVRDGHMNLLKCAGPQNVSDVLTKSLPRPTFEKHREFMVGTRVPFSAFYAKVTKAIEPIVAYVIKLPIPMHSKKSLFSYCAGG